MITRRRVLATSGSAALMSALAGLLAPSSARAQQEVSPEQLAEAKRLPDHFLGRPDAPVTIIEYASMTCPHCAAFHAQTFPQLKESYIDTGKARFALREFPLDVGAVAAFMLARCAAGDDTRLAGSANASNVDVPPESTDRYYALVDALFAQQRTWATAENLENALFDVAKQAGFTQETFRACLTNQQLYEAVRAQGDAGAKLQVRSTPTFFVNGKPARGAVSFADFSKLIDSEL